MSPLLFIPGLLCSPEVFGPQINSLWRLGPVMVASTLDASTIEDAAAKILEKAPPRFALAGLSMGGYICFEIMRQAPRRVLKLALLDTSARPRYGRAVGHPPGKPRRGAGRPLSRCRPPEFERAASSSPATGPVAAWNQPPDGHVGRSGGLFAPA